MAATTLLSDNGVTSGITGYQLTGGNDGTLQLQTTTAGGTATTAVTIGTNQVATFAQAPVLPAASIPQAALAANVAGNGPAFSVALGSDQVLTAGAYTKLAFSVEAFDTNSNYNTSLYRFTPTVAGYYQVNVGVISYGTDISQVIVYKNGSGMFGAYPTLNQGVTFGGIVYLNGSTDYIELYCSLGANGTIRDIDYLTYFQGFLARAA